MVFKSKRYSLKRAHKCEDRQEMEEELSKLNLPKNFKLVITGEEEWEKVL